MARGTSEKPITFTSQSGPAANASTSTTVMHGLWGGLVILGRAPIATANTGVHCGHEYGGTNASDDSGILQYVRVWYGGAVMIANNESSGITFAGVGSGTTVDHIEVAYSLGDGVEFFGGTVNIKYMSVLCFRHDGIDIDHGYQGKIQFAFVVVGEHGHRGANLDSKAIPSPVQNLSSKPLAADGNAGNNSNASSHYHLRSSPQLWNALFIGGAGSAESAALNEQLKGLIVLRGGTGGELGNILMVNVPGVGVLQTDCGLEQHTPLAPNSSAPNSSALNSASNSSASSAPTAAPPGYLWLSSKNVMVGNRAAQAMKLGAGCVGNTSMTQLLDAELMLLPISFTESSRFIDPRPKPGSKAVYDDLDTPTDAFFTKVKYRGAFGTENWLDGWSYLSEVGKLPANVNAEVLPSFISADFVLGSKDYLMTSQVFVKPGATLTIKAGATIRAYAEDETGRAPTLVIERGAKIDADGTESNPITFTSAANQKALPSHGMWGGLIILGNAPVTNGSASVEGLPIGNGSSGGNASIISSSGGNTSVIENGSSGGNASISSSSGGNTSVINGSGRTEGVQVGNGAYGGTDESDSSGVLRYVRVWYGGRMIGKDNEINGITFAGVGSGTTVEHIEVAFSLDDGVEIFGGTVNVKYLSIYHCGDDGIDIDEGYTGKIQFAFVVVGAEGHHGAEMSSKVGNNGSNRSFPQVYNALFVGSLSNSPAPVSSDDQHPAMIRLREATGGEFGNIVMVNVANYGVWQDSCGSEARVQALPAPKPKPDYLFFSKKNYIYGPAQDPPFELLTGCAGFTSADRTNPQLQAVPLNPKFTEKFDPRPRSTSQVLLDYDEVPDDSFFVTVPYSGAFSAKAEECWLRKWTWLATAGLLDIPFPQQQDNEPDNTLFVALAIAGTVFGVLAFSCSVFFYCRMKKAQRKYTNLESSTANVGGQVIGSASV